MREIKIEKITLNIGTGEPGNKLDNAMALLKKITGKKPIQTITKKRIPTWKIRPGLAIGCKVTVRDNGKTDLLKRLLASKNNALSGKNFTESGVCFGIHEYIEIPRVEYDPDIGIIGLDVAVTLMRPGYRVKNRVIRKGSISHKHKITRDESIKFFREKFGVKLDE